MKTYARIDPKTGVVHQTLRGPNNTPCPDGWREVTNDENVFELHDPEHQRRWKMGGDGCLCRKPVVNMTQDKLVLRPDGQDAVTFTLTDVPPEGVVVNVGGKLTRVTPDDPELRVTTRRDGAFIPVRIEDDTVYVPHEPRGAIAREPVENA